LHSYKCDKKNESENSHKNCHGLSRVKSTKYSVVIFDDQLKWKIHIESVISRFRKCFYIFKELRSILDISNIKIIYFATVQSILTYGTTTWRSAYKNAALETLNVVHRTLVRIILKQDYIVGCMFTQVNKLKFCMGKYCNIILQNMCFYSFISLVN